MKILIITMDVGKSSPGIVFEKLIHGLSLKHQIDLVAADYDPSIDLANVCKTIICARYNIHPRINRFFITLFNVNPLDCLWAWNCKNLVKNDANNKYDIILSFLTYDNYAATIAGTWLSKKIKCKLAVHSTDAVPPPVGWLKHDLYYKSLKKMMAKYLGRTDAFFTTNHQMLQYQMNTFTAKKNLISNVIYNPGMNKFKDFPKPDISINNFVYTGGIYGVRKADYVIKGFEKLLEIYPGSQLIFVGSSSSAIPVSGIENKTLNKINVVPHTRDLDPYYKCATALIDIDADIDNDVFISSKMPNYLMINRMIISETGNNSPSRHLFKGIGSIIQCDHDPDQLCEAMRKSIESKHTISFEDRNTIIKLFQVENIVEQINISLKQMNTT